MSMTIAARSNHVHHVSAKAAAPARPRLMPLVWFRRKLRARPGTTLAHCAFAIASVLIIVNALAFQREAAARRIAAEQQAAVSARSLNASPATPVPPTRPAELSSAPNRGTQIAAPVPSPAAALPATSASTLRAPPAREASSRDAIGDLIRTGQVGAGEPARTEGTRTPGTPDQKPILAAQRALNKVGQGPVKADGVFGEETRAALERFERERRIPVTRDLSPRTLRELTAASGIRME